MPYFSEEKWQEVKRDFRRRVGRFVRWESPLVLELDEQGYLCSWPTRVVYHSPAGVAWGYSGSGPARLALCIADTIWPVSESHTGTVRVGAQRVSRLAWLVHQAIKRALIARMPDSGGTVDAIGVHWMSYLCAMGLREYDHVGRIAIDTNAALYHQHFDENALIQSCRWCDFRADFRGLDRFGAEQLAQEVANHQAVAHGQSWNFPDGFRWPTK